MLIASLSSHEVTASRLFHAVKMTTEWQPQVVRLLTWKLWDLAAGTENGSCQSTESWAWLPYSNGQAITKSTYIDPPPPNGSSGQEFAAIFNLVCPLRRNRFSATPKLTVTCVTLLHHPFLEAMITAQFRCCLTG